MSRSPSKQLPLPATTAIAMEMVTAAELPGPSDDARLAWRRILEIVRLIVARIGPKEVAFRLDTSPSLLADALAERDRKRFAAEWLTVILQLADYGEVEQLLVELALVARCALRLQPLANQTAEERLAELERRVRDRFGQAGAELLEERRR